MDAGITIATPLAAAAAGLATSLHCVGMCGPLACALRVRPMEYHAGRLFSYSLAGALCGAAGQGIVTFLKGDTSHVLPWVLSAVLLLLGFGLEKQLPRPQFLSKWLLRARLNRTLGLLTPLLPCGPLWLMLGAAAATGAWQAGALLMTAFVAGTIPLPLLLQSQATRLRRRFSPNLLRWTQQGIALIAAALLVWRASLPVDACCH
jgi:sulfite exporter TauE/SafE